jgi:outer membrane protein assembly factor BamD
MPILDRGLWSASETYKEFESVHPRSEEIPYVLYQIGVSNSSAPNPSTCRKTISRSPPVFLSAGTDFPGYRVRKEAKDYIRRCRMRLAEHELFVADFYWRTGQYGAAWKRYNVHGGELQGIAESRVLCQPAAQLSYLEYQKTLYEEERRQIQGSWRNWAKRWL